MKTLIATLFLLAFVLTGCTPSEPQIAQPMLLYVPAVAAAPAALEPQPNFARLTLKIELGGYTPARLEPSSGVLAGAYIKRDFLSPSIRAFENSLGVSHAIYAYSMTLGDDFPLRWILENIAAMKTPLITIHPNERGFDTDALQELAHNAARFNVPIFINLFPLTADSNFLPSGYIAFFRYAHRLFAQHAPNAAIVWSLDAESLPVSRQFYPGRDYVDWINLIIYNPVSALGEFRDFFSYVDVFNTMFQRERPLMITTAVSHYTTENNAYFSQEAADFITHIYSRLADYPRIKAIIYQNYDEMHPGMARHARFAQNYMINAVAQIQAAYTAAVSNSRFLPVLPSPAPPASTAIRIRSPFPAITYYGFFYIPRHALVYDLRLGGIEALAGREAIFYEREYYNMVDLNEIFGMDFFINAHEGFLVLR